MFGRILFAPGAGAGKDSEWMLNMATELRRHHEVVTFDYDYRAEGRRAPDRLPQLISTHARALHEAFGNSADDAATAVRRPVVLAGKSMGGRIGCHVALQAKVDGLVCFGYPLVGIGPKAPRRDQVLLALETPILFVQGTRDKLCPLAELAEVRQRMKAKSEVVIIESGDHSLLATKTWQRQHGATQSDIFRDIGERVDAFVKGLRSLDG